MMDRASIEKILRNPETWRFVKFLFVGGLNTLFGYVVFALLVLAGLEDQTALVIAYFIGVIWNYFTHARLVFDAKGYGQVPAYIAVYVALYALNAGALHLLTSAGLIPLLAQAVILPFAAILSFIFLSKVLTGYFPFQRKPA